MRNIRYKDPKNIALYSDNTQNMTILENEKRHTTEDRVKELENDILKIKKKINWGLSIVSFVGVVAGCFGFNFWLSISSKINELNVEAEKVEARQIELNKQMLLAGQNNIKLNTKFVDFSALISTKYEEQLQRVTELNKIASKALLDSERAMHNAGMLVDAVKMAQASADHCEATNKHIHAQIKIIESYLKSINNSFKAIQETQGNLESYIAKNIRTIHPGNNFKISVSSHYGTYIIIEGDAIPCDKRYSGYEVTGYIVIPKNCNATIDDSGYENTFWVSDKIKTRVDIVGTGKYRHVHSGERSFK